MMRVAKSLSYFCVLALCVSLTGCGTKKEAENPDLTVAVKTMKTEKGSLAKESLYIGTIENTEAVELVCRVSGTVDELNAAVGDHVVKDTVLAHFDDTSAEIDLNGTKTAVESAKKGYESAQKSLETAQANYNSTVTRGVNSLTSEHHLSDYQKGMNLQSLESDIAYLGEKIGEYKDTTIADLEDDIHDYKKKKKRAKNDGDEESYQKYKELLDAAEKNLDSAEQNLLDMEHNYNSKVKDYETAAGVRNITNEEVYPGQQMEVMDSITVAQKNVESAQIGVGSAATSVESARNKVEAAEYQLGLYDVKTPIDGVVEEVNLEKNNYYSAGKVGFKIANPDSKRAVFYVTDTVLPNLKVGQKVEATVNNKDYKGEIAEVALAADENNGLFEVKAFLDDASDIMAGVGVKVRTVIHESKNKVLIPSDAIYYSDNEPYVYVDDNGTAVKRVVTIDIYGETETTIEEGLNEGEILITSWSGTLHDGAKVREENDGAQASGAVRQPDDKEDSSIISKVTGMETAQAAEIDTIEGSTEMPSAGEAKHVIY